MRWWLGRKDASQESLVGKDYEEDASAFCRRLIKVFQEKADHNKAEAIWSIRLLIGSTLVAPFFIALGGENFFFAKFVPSTLSLGAAATTAWLQLRKPQQLWATYRNAQRELEDHHYRHRFKLDMYDTSENADKLLAKSAADIAIGVHRHWMILVPNPEGFMGTSTGASGTQAIKERGE